MPPTKRIRSASPELGTPTRTRKMVTIAIDPGTTSTSVSYTVEGRKEDPTCIVWRNNNKDAANCETPAKFYYRARDGPNKGWDFVCGCDVEVARMNNRIPIEDVIMGLKIATLVQEDFSQQYLQPIVAKLAPIGKTLEDLWYDYFRYLLDKTIKDIKTNERIGEAEWVKMERELLIAMPNLSEPSGNLVFTRVGKRLADRCYIVKEATCGATTVLEDDIKSKPKSGEKVIVLDLGGGFCSPTAHRVRRDTRNGTYFLEDLACSNSQMAGAVFINKDFENELGTWMQDRDQQDLDEVARRLGLTPDIFKLKASECFEKDLKHTFPDAEEYLVQVVNSTNMRNWMMKLFKADIEKLFARWMKKIYEALDELLETVGGSPGFQHVILRGGLASNPWVRNALQQHYTQFSFSLRGTQIPCPVANGALIAWRHQKAAPQHFHIGTARDEEFHVNNSYHKDLIVFRGDDDRRTQFVDNEKLLASGRADPEVTWAVARMNWFEHKVDTAGGKWITSEDWEKISVSAKKFFKATYDYDQVLYYTTNKPRDHEPLWKSSGLGEVVPQDHIKEFHNKIIVPLGQRDGWKRVKWTNGEEVFELWLGTRVAVPANGVGQWETYHAPRHSLPTADQPLKENDWALTTEIFDSRFSHAPLG